MLGGHPALSEIGEFEESVRWLGDTGEISVDEFRRRLAGDRVFNRRGVALPHADSYIGAVRELENSIFPDPAVRRGFVIHTRPDRAYEIWPDATYIHLVRDPRDVAKSCVGMGWAGEPWAGAHHWIESDTRCRRLRAQVSPGNWIRLSYEELVARHRHVLESLLKTLELEWDDGVYAYADDTAYDLPDTSAVQRWKRHSGARWIELVEARCGDRLTEAGYTRSVESPRPPGRSERIGLVVRGRVRRFAESRRRYGLGLAIARIGLRFLPPGGRVRLAIERSVNRRAEALLK